MFAPEGYDFFSDFVQEIQELYLQDMESFAHLLPNEEKTEALKRENVDLVFDMMLILSIYFEYLVTADDELRKNIFVCDANGLLLRLNSICLSSNIAIGDHRLNPPISLFIDWIQAGEIETAESYLDALNSLRFEAYSMYGVITGFDLEHCRERLWEFYTEKTYEPFRNASVHGRTNPEEDIEYTLDILENYNRLLEPIVGRSLCYKAGAFDDLLTNPLNHSVRYGHRLRHSNDTPIGTIADEKAAEFKFLEYMRDNPETKMSKSEAFKKFGISVSQKGFNQRIWPKIAEKFPHLSRPGRKS